MRSHSDPLVTAGSGYIGQRKWQLFYKRNRMGFIKRTKVNFLFLKLIEAEVAPQVFLVSFMLLRRGVLFACIAVPVPIPGLPKARVSVLRQCSAKSSYCEYWLYACVEPSGEREDYTRALCHLPFVPSFINFQEVELVIPMASQCWS